MLATHTHTMCECGFYFSTVAGNTRERKPTHTMSTSSFDTYTHVSSRACLPLFPLPPSLSCSYVHVRVLSPALALMYFQGSKLYLMDCSHPEEGLHCLVQVLAYAHTPPIPTCAHTPTRAHTCTRTHTHTQTHKRACAQSRTCTLTCAHTHIRTHTHTDMYTHTYLQAHARACALARTHSD